MATSVPSTSTPVPSHHVFLHELPDYQTGAKVRFICCVLDYDSESGKLLVEHAYPPDTANIPRAHLDVTVVLECTKSELLLRGAWLNIIGYILEGSEGRRKAKRSSIARHAQPAIPMVQVVLLWDAGPIQAAKYEATMTKHRETLKKAKEVVQKYQ